MNLTTYKKNTASFVIVVGIMAGIGMISYRNLLEYQKNIRWVTHTYTVIKNTKEVILEINNAETGQRGYLITGKGQYLQPYDIATDKIPKTLQVLRQLTRDNPNQQRRLSIFESLIAKKLDSLKITVNFATNKNLPLALQRFDSKESHKLLQDIQMLAKDIESEENHLLKQRTIDMNLSAANTNAFTSFASIIASALVGLATLFTNQELAKRKRVENSLQQASEHLETTVKQRTDELLKTNQQLQTEIYQHEHTLKALSLREKEFKALVENAPDIIARFNTQLRYVYVNPAFQKLTNILPQTFIGKANRQLNLPEEFYQIWEYKIQSVIQTKQENEFECSFPTTSGIEYYHTRLLPEFAADGSVEFVMSIARNITALKLAQAQLIHDAFHDSLTGLPNRALFIERLERAIALTKRRTDYKFAVFFLDVDRFKVVNDSLGHTIGDQLLNAIARRLETCLRSQDTVARIGGDEFTILLNDFKNLNDITFVVERINAVITSAFNLNGRDVFTNVSIGVALSKSSYNLPEEILRDADIAMYRAKALGKARYELFDSTMYAQATELMQLEMDLRHAIEHQEFIIHYQPIILLETYKVIGFEALVRWQHPQHGFVSPDKFIPIAEETGLIVPIGYWVMREACRQLRAWQEQFPTSPPLTISVNISTKQFSQPDLIGQIRQILQETGVEGRSLKLEITESAIMENTESTTAMLLHLQQMNVQLHLDDFGTGYSSLSYLHRFPTNALKIDRSFVMNIGVNGENLEIVQAIITLADSLNLDVVAEGVETVEQLAQLAIYKCKYAQGYFFSKPLNSNLASTLIASGLNFESN
ncbi:EAL domain-containing protein [Nostoc sp. FACHB-892]|uniref:EAL domain-containing protein n=1 Tax=Nostoc sp. FACHB-892 TaxID=2692843 RepID=UPI001684B747|nr:EAL domain-containing protein [Nostoc sp. FACHB-892]MBD2730212.1 EAL domain-containing protein [Nostoc sp. FACHB-892]